MELVGHLTGQRAIRLKPTRKCQREKKMKKLLMLARRAPGVCRFQVAVGAPVEWPVISVVERLLSRNSFGGRKASADERQKKKMTQPIDSGRERRGQVWPPGVGVTKCDQIFLVERCARCSCTVTL